MPDASAPTSSSIAASARRKVAWRILPLIFLLYIIAYLDRANLGFAKLQMSGTVGFLSDEVYGWGAGLFFIGYLVLEIPGALFVEHWSARKWFARILITWGLCSMGMALVSSEGEFYLARFLLGLAEAGFFPGVIVYFTHWFPRRDRARALAAMVLGIPASLALGARVSALLLELNLFGLSGWQWVFIVEGFPAVLLGVAVPFLLTDRPSQARWLTQAEKDWLETTLKNERAEAAAQTGGTSLLIALRQPVVWLLALGIMVTNIGGYALVFWLPTAVKGLLTSTGTSATDTAVLNWTGIVYLCGFAGVGVWGWSSDRNGERKWHCVAGQVGTGVFLALSAYPDQPWAMVFVWLCLAGFFAYAWPSPFWVLPTLALTSSAAAVSIGFINMCANIAGFIGSPIVGNMRQAGLSDGACLFFLAACYATGGLIIAMIPIRSGRKSPP